MSLRALVVVLLLSACGGSSPPPALPKPAITIDVAHVEAQLTPHIESYGRHRGERRKLSGYVLVAQHDQPVYARGFGFADRETRRAPTADTSFRIGSVTKQFTATAILLLAEDGKLAVTDTIGTHLPDYPAVGAGVTIHQLLTHTGGIPSYTSDQELMARRDQPITPAQLLATFWDKPLEFEPGTKFAYSNSGYAVLGAIIEKVSGTSYGEFLRTRLFEPAGMTRTVVGDAAGIEDRAEGYEVDGDAIVRAHPIDMSMPFAAGAVRSTANDLVKWHRALEGDAILSAASKQLLYKPEKQGYAYGWGVGDHDGHQVISHGGGIDGFLTSYMRIPDLDLVIVVWSNNMAIDVGPIGHAALDAALGKTLEPAPEQEVIPLDRGLAERTVGTYRLTDASRESLIEEGVPEQAIETFATLIMKLEGDQLMFQPIGQRAFPLDATGPNAYAAEQIGLTIEVAMPAEGPATGFKASQGGGTIEYVREAD
jgi:CubicO group peptidase (beta-lactamase class C family)